jgi:hypothetical protein
MMTGKSPGGVVGFAAGGGVDAGTLVADPPLVPDPLLVPLPVDGLMAGAEVGPPAGAVGNRVTTGTGVATEPAGATAPRTIQPVTPLDVSRT